MRILIVDDHDLVRDTLSAFLDREGGFEISVAADLSGAEVEIGRAGPFDLVLLDYAMPGMNGLDGLGRVIGLNGGQPVALMSGSADRTVAQAALDSGAAGFLPKTMAARSLVNAIRFMAAGEVYMPLDLHRPSQAVEATPSGLSRRELEVLAGLCAGHANKEIARDLGLREPTIKLHVKTICRKLDARNRTHAAMIARERALC